MTKEGLPSRFYSSTPATRQWSCPGCGATMSSELKPGTFHLTHDCSVELQAAGYHVTVNEDGTIEVS